jgi:protease PrsW
MSILLALYICLVAAVVPTAVYVLIFYWADRYEREPAWLVAVAFLWGAIPAVIVSLVAELLLGIPLADARLFLTTELIESTILAPIIEELAKGAALLAIFRFARREFDGVLDGLLYGALIGFGFAMTENLLYYIGAYAEGGFGSLTFVIILRALVFGLNHSFYTALTGMGLGLARNARTSVARWLWPVIGLLLAVITHGLHNYGAGLAAENIAGLGISLLVAGGGLCLMVLTVLLSWQAERKAIRTELADEVGTTISTAEYTTLTGRWRNPFRKRPLDRECTDCLRLGVELAVRKQRLRRLGVAREPGLQAEIGQLRQQLMQIQRKA